MISRKRHCHTTVTGAAAGLSALAAIPGVLPPPFNIIAAAVSAVALALLGHSAADAKVVNKIDDRTSGK